MFFFRFFAGQKMNAEDELSDLQNANVHFAQLNTEEDQAIGGLK